MMGEFNVTSDCVTVVGSVFWWRCDMLCTSGFVDNVILGRIQRRDGTVAVSPQCRA